MSGEYVTDARMMYGCGCVRGRCVSDVWWDVGGDDGGMVVVVGDSGGILEVGCCDGCVRIGIGT